MAWFGIVRPLGRIRATWYHSSMALHEREFFNETHETKPASFACPRCRFRGDYTVRWIRRIKKDRPPRGADGRDRTMFAKLRNYMVRVDDVVVCQKCRSRFDIPSHQHLAFF